jgi:subtilisin family serine protease
MRNFLFINRLALAACLIFALGSCEEDFTASKKNSGEAPAIEGQFFNGEQSYILIAKNNLPNGLAEKVASLGGELVSTTPQAGIAVVQASDASFAANASSIDGVQAVVPNVKIQFIAPSENVVVSEDEYSNPPASGDDDFFFDLQWGHDAVDAVEAWNAGYFGEGARVAVLDGGFDLDHPDLAPNINLGLSADFTGEGLEYGFPDTFSHGTHVAGTIGAADNGFGVIGVAPQVELVLVKVLGDAGSGSFADVIAGIIHAADVDADIMNMSLGAYFDKNGNIIGEDGEKITMPAAETAALKNAIQKAVTYAYQQGTTVISSAGNDAINGQADKSGISVPSDLAHVINISATAPVGWAVDPASADFGRLASYSNFGNKVDFAAPGGDAAYPGNEGCVVAGLARPCWVFDLVFSTGNGGWYWSAGTSMASPHAAGVAALIVGANGGEMSPAQVEAELKKTAVDIYKPGRDAESGHGLVNAYNAVVSQ